MLRFVPTDSIVEAICFDGSPDSALAVAKALGKTVAVSIDGETVRLTLAKKAVPAASWIARVGKRHRVLTADAFKSRFQPLPTEAAPFIHKLRAQAERPPGAIREGDFITYPGMDEGEEAEVIEIEGDMLRLDTTWGSKTISLADAALARRP